MNNSIISYNNLEDDEEVKPLKNKLAELSKIVEAISQVESTPEWKNLKKVLIDDVVANIERLLSSEARKPEINTPEIYRLQGQLTWARRYADLKKLAESFMLQITNLKKQIYEKNPRDGAL